MNSKKFFVILFAVFIISCPLYYLLSASGIKVYIITSDNKISVSENNGKSWEQCNRGLPANCIPLRMYTAGRNLYLATFSSGLFRITNGRWISLNSQQFKRRSIYDKEPGFRKISAFAADPEDENNIAVATKHSIYRSPDAGLNWTEIPLNGLNRRNYITSLAITGEKVYAATSFNGVFELQGKSFVSSGDRLPSEPYSDTLKFTEQISFLAVNKKNLYAGFSFGGGLYVKKNGERNFNPIVAYAENKLNSVIYDIQFTDKELFFTENMKIFKSGGDFKPVDFPVYTEIINRLYVYDGISSATIFDETGSLPALTLKTGYPETIKRSTISANRKALYLSVPALKHLDTHIEEIKKTEINAVVIDMKDDFGNIYFTASSGTASEIKAQKNPVDIKTILKKLKKNNIYAIARIVTFKDQKMFSAFNGTYAIKNKKTGKSWQGAEGEFWVDAHSEFVQDYNIGLALDLEKAGFDEIQFDYIRFPSDGAINLCNFTYKKDPDTYKSEILIDFLKKAQDSITIPVSVDIYGFNSWYYFGNWIGQDMEELSYVVDVICPMVYPSHFGNRFYSKIDSRTRPYRIVYDGGLRAMLMVNRSVSIRPYLQAFNLLSPTWGPDYIRCQINAARKSGCGGYTLWNAKTDYSVSYKALKK
ncbi:MAG TPA: putative glycoside hydrolase [Spirochaetota bacterium]|nr:putative glycoside hydrolase [Spirochaetota bacterium]